MGNFVISSSSCLICMVYFGMNVAIGSTVNNLVFAFMAVSFGFDCLVFLGQVVVFNHPFNDEDKNYLIAFWDQKFEDRTRWDTDDEAKEKYVKALGNGHHKFENREEKQKLI